LGELDKCRVWEGITADLKPQSTEKPEKIPRTSYPSFFALEELYVKLYESAQRKVHQSPHTDIFQQKLSVH
jgi:hypothetical protein